MTKGFPRLCGHSPWTANSLSGTGDDDLINWTKREAPVISAPPELPPAGFPSITGDSSADFRDPFVWREGNGGFF